MRSPLFPFCPGARFRKAFSLIELLSVMTLISVLAVAAVPAMRGTLDGINIGGAAGVLESEISMARQLAISRNLPVEVRIYKYDDGNGMAWRAVSSVIPSKASGQAADEWVTAPKILPGNVIIDDSQEFSTVVSKAQSPVSDPAVAPWTTTETSATSVPALVRGKNYVGFCFNPDGSTNLPNNAPWCLTLRNPNSKPAGSGPAANYVSIVVDSLTGRTLSYQP
jgi:uncharacterized protein (TIGR02596 family)